MLKKGSKASKSFLLSLALLMTLVVVLAACSSGKNNTATESSAAPAESSAPPASSAAAPEDDSLDPSKLPEYNLTIFFPGAPPKDEAIVEAEINKYLKDKINATIDIQMIDWGQWDNKMNLAIASRDPMDIIFTASWNGHTTNVAKGAFLALNDPSGPHGNLLEKHGKDILSSLPEVFLTSAKVDGFNYGVPANKELAEQGGILYRTDIADELGLTEQIENVKTIEDLGPILQVVKEKRQDLIPLFMRDGENFNTHYFAKYDFVGDATVEGVVMKDGTETIIKPRIEYPIYKRTLEVTRDYFNKGYINKDAATTQLGVQDAMKKGNVFMVPSPLKPGKDSELAGSTGLEGKLKQVAMNIPTTSSSETTGSMLGISTTSGDPERAMMFINLLHSDKYLNNLINFGIEGTHYTLDGEQMTPTADAGNYAIGAAWMLGNQFLNYLVAGEAADKWDQFRKFNESTHNSPALGFLFDPEPVSSQVAVMANIRKQYDPGLDTGSIDPSKAEEFFEKLRQNGLDDVIAEKQRQLDAYLGK